MANPQSTIHYSPGTQQKVSGKTALIVVASAIAVIVAVVAFVH
jgi:hypothetical protein